MPANPKPPKPIRDATYTRSAVDRPCMVLGCPTLGGPTVVCAHINIAGNFGLSQKAGDDESFWLCSKHHQEMDQYPEQRDRWIVRNIVIPQRKEAYRRWSIGLKS